MMDQCFHLPFFFFTVCFCAAPEVLSGGSLGFCFPLSEAEPSHRADLSSQRLDGDCVVEEEQTGDENNTPAPL